MFIDLVVFCSLAIDFEFVLFKTVKGSGMVIAWSWFVAKKVNKYLIKVLDTGKWNKIRKSLPLRDKCTLY